MGVEATSVGVGWRLLRGLNVALAVLLVLALLVGTNLLARKPILRGRLDLSPDASFTLSPQTRGQVLALLAHGALAEDFAGGDLLKAYEAILNDSGVFGTRQSFESKGSSPHNCWSS